MKKYLFSALLLGFLGGTLWAQESNLEKYTPSVLLEKGRWESNTFYSIYTQTQVTDFDGDNIDLGQRQTFLNAMYQFTFGTSESGRINLGIDVWATRALYDDFCRR